MCRNSHEVALSSSVQNARKIENINLTQVFLLQLTTTKSSKTPSTAITVKALTPVPKAVTLRIYWQHWQTQAFRYKYKVQKQQHHFGTLLYAMS